MQPTFTMELANGCNGYRPTPEPYRLGGYENWPRRTSYLEVDASTRILSTMIGLLNRVRP